MDISARKKDGNPKHKFPTFEHLVRKREGGDFTDGNIVLAHYSCNKKGLDTTLALE